MFSYTAASAPAPKALSMALLILSLGMDCALALATAAAREALLSGLGSLPRRAATVMLRESLENSAERLASCAPLRCLVVAHFECPDMRDSFYTLLAERAENISPGAPARLTINGNMIYRLAQLVQGSHARQNVRHNRRIRQRNALWDRHEAARRAAEQRTSRRCPA